MMKNIEEDVLYIEGFILLSYILGRSPTPSLIERYCRAIRVKTKHPTVINFPAIYKIFPSLLYLIEPFRNSETPIINIFKKKINIAMVLVDTSVEGTYLFYNFEYNNRFKLILKMLIYIFFEIILFPIRLLPLIKLLKYEKS